MRQLVAALAPVGWVAEVAAMDPSHFDEFGNYIGPELSGSDSVSLGLALLAGNDRMIQISMDA